MNLLRAVINKSATNIGESGANVHLALRSQIGEKTITQYLSVKAWGGVAKIAKQFQPGTVVDIPVRMSQRMDEGRSFTDVTAERITGVVSPAFTFGEDKNGGLILDQGQNVVRLQGNLVRDVMSIGKPESGGVRGTVAVNERFTTKDGPQERVSYIDFVAWNGIATDGKKGDPVVVTGAVLDSNYVNKDGETVWKTEITATEYLNIAYSDRAEEQPEVAAPAKKSSKRSAPAPQAGANPEDLPF